MASTYLEYTMSINKIKRPTVYKDKDATYILLVRLLLLEPGTNQAFPKMGIGLFSRYRYNYADKMNTLVEEYKEQIATYLPGLELVDITAEVRDKTLVLKVNIDNETIYPIMADMVKLSLKEL